MSPGRLALLRAEQRLVDRLADLEARLESHPGLWHEYAQVSAALASIVPTTAPGAAGELLTTAQLAARLQVSPKTVRRRAKAGELTPVRLGERGRSALRWVAR